MNEIQVLRSNKNGFGHEERERMQAEMSRMQNLLDARPKASQMNPE
jgi:hypothetical protein